MSDKTHKQAAISRRAALKKLGLGTAAFVAPVAMTVSEAEAKSRGFRQSKNGKRSKRTKSTKSNSSDDCGCPNGDYDYGSPKES